MKEEENMELKTPLYDAHVKAGGTVSYTHLDVYKRQI